MTEKIYDIAVIGAGGAGIMAFLRGVLNNDDCVLFLGDGSTKKKGRSTWVMEVDNIPGFHDIKRPITSSGNNTLKWLRAQEHLADRATEIKAAVTKLEKDGDLFVVHHVLKKEPATVKARHVILCTGLMDCQPKIQGDMAPIFPYANRGDALYCIRCDGHRTMGETVSVIGHSDNAVGIAAMLQERYNHQNIDVLLNGNTSTISERSMNLAKAYNMTIHASPIAEVLGEPKVKLAGFRLEDGTEVACTNTFISLGSMVYNQLLTELGGEVEESGRVVVSDKMESSIDNIFVAGDLVAGKKMQVYTAWDGAVDAADEINRRIRSAKRKEALVKTAG